MRNDLLALAALLCTVNLCAQPTITSFIPTFGPVGTIVTINGTHFDPVLSNNVVYFDQRPEFVMFI